MAEEIKIPYGYKRVFGHSEKGDGLWDGQAFKRVKKQYPLIREDQVCIRRCEVVQEVLPGVAEEPFDFSE